jgi:anti-sigma28 factor (negative regulator of flagellin synthesis)
MPTDGLKWGDLPAAPSIASTRARRSSTLANGTEAEERVQRVEAFRRACASGTYRVDSLEIADRLLERRVLEGEEL